MDDIWAMGSSEAALRALQVDLQDALREAGMDMNLAKTDLLEGDELARVALDANHSGVDVALAEDLPNTGPLEELVDLLVAEPLLANRTTVHFATKRLRDAQVHSRNDELITVAVKLPHAADHLARLFRDFNLWEGLQDWYVDYESSHWARIEWSVAQFGTMFPTKVKAGSTISSGLIDCFKQMLGERRSLPVFALTAQRLSLWAPEVCREMLRAMLPRLDHPHERRVAGLVALGLGEERDYVRRVLSEYEENAITLSAIEARGFRAMPLVPDFSANQAP